MMFNKERYLKMDETICPVCGNHHFEEKNAYEECPVCGWADDLLQRCDHDYKGGFNRISVNEAKKIYASGRKIY